MIKKAFLFFSFALILLLNACAPAAAGQIPLDIFDRADTVKFGDLEIDGGKNPLIIKETLKGQLDAFDAKIIEESWRDRLSINYSGFIVIQLPSNRFSEMVDWITDNLTVESIRISARESIAGDEKQGLVQNGVVYANIYLSIQNYQKSYLESFLLGWEYANEAFKFSLETVVPVIIFLSPYAITILFIIFVIKFLINLIKNTVKRIKDKEKKGVDLKETS